MNETNLCWDTDAPQSPSPSARQWSQQSRQCKLLHCPGAVLEKWPGAEQSDGPRDPQALHRMGKFSCCCMQDNLILKDETEDGLHGKQKYIAMFQETGKSDI